MMPQPLRKRHPGYCRLADSPMGDSYKMVSLSDRIGKWYFLRRYTPKVASLFDCPFVIIPGSWSSVISRHPAQDSGQHGCKGRGRPYSAPFVTFLHSQISTGTSIALDFWSGKSCFR